MTEQLDQREGSSRHQDLVWAAVDSAVTLALVLVAVLERSAVMGLLGAFWFAVAVRQAGLYLKARRP